MKALRVLGVVLGTLCLVMAGAAGFFYYQGGLTVTKTYPVAAHHSPYGTDSAYTAHGRHVSVILRCQECHGENLEGRVMIDAAPFLVAPSNLTSGQGGVMAGYDEQQLEILIRHGVKNSGRAVFFMPSFNSINDYDMSALAAYIRSVKPVDNELPASELRFLGRVLTGAGLFPYDMNVNLKNSDHPDIVEQQASPVFGEYLVNLTCANCHGADLKGGKSPEPGGPPVPSLEASAFWNSSYFANAIRKGVTPEGKQINGRYMPWPAFSAFSDMEILAIKMYVDVKFRAPRGEVSQP